jgi:hypothetical protein
MGGTLGLRFVEDLPIAKVFDANGVALRVALVDCLTPQASTVLGWTVREIESAVRSLSANGVGFERFPEMDQDDLGIWTTPGGDRVAWLRGPDRNVLSLTELRNRRG